MLNAAFYLVKTISLLYLLTFLFRFVLQWVRGDFYNPFSQFIVKVTSPLVVPARRILPSVGEVDVPTLIVLVLLECIATFLLVTMAGDSMAIDTFFLYVVLRLIGLTLWFYSICIFVYVILSFFAQASYSPIAMLLGQVVGPVLRPVRRILPPIAGLDLSPLVVLIVLQALMRALPLPAYLHY
jgi:YggT family protein